VRDEVYYPYLVSDDREFAGRPDHPGILATPAELFDYDVRRHKAWAEHAASSDPRPECEFGDRVIRAIAELRDALERSDALSAAIAALDVGVQATAGRFVERLEPVLIEAMRSRDGIAKGSSRRAWFDRIQERNARDAPSRTSTRARHGVHRGPYDSASLRRPGAEPRRCAVPCSPRSRAITLQGARWSKHWTHDRRRA
jgi:hypothetical protein